MTNIDKEHPNKSQKHTISEKQVDFCSDTSKDYVLWEVYNKIIEFVKEEMFLKLRYGSLQELFCNFVII
jgi:hypothetical protein